MSSSVDTSLQDVITISENEVGEDEKGEEEHQCGKWCSKIEEEQINRMKNQVTVLKDGVYIRTSSPYSVPFALGWERFEYYYNSPCGIKLYDLKHVMKYLIKTKSKLSIKQFTFSNDFTYISIPLDEKDRVICQDISNGKEAIAVRCINNHDDEIIDPNFEYVRKNIYPCGINDEPRSFRSTCSCEDDCKNILKCKCRHLTDEAEDLGQLQGILDSKRFAGQSLEPKHLSDQSLESKHFAGQLHRLLDSKYFAGYQGVEKELTRPYVFGLYECNSDCSCSDKCYNKVVQNGMTNQLEVFRTEDGRGWGVRCRHDLHSGDFLATYTGQIISYSEAEMRGMENDEYFTKMNLIEIVEEKEGFEESAKEISELDDDEISKQVMELSSEETEPSESILSDVSCSSSSSEVEFVFMRDKRNEGNLKQKERNLKQKDRRSKKLCVREDVTFKDEWKDIDRFVPVRKYIAENTIQNGISTSSQVTRTVSAETERSPQQENVRKEGLSEENSMREAEEIWKREEERSWKAEESLTKDELSAKSEEEERSWKTEESSRKDELSAKEENESVQGRESPVQKCLNDPLDSFRFVLDGKRKGNIGRFLNHSCRPNCYLQIVFTDTHDPRMYELALFTAQNIPAMTELTWNYLYQKEHKNKFICLCEACKRDKQETNDVEARRRETGKDN